MKIYSGIGSRETPPDILKQMAHIAKLASRKFILRSGGAYGADSTFEKSCDLNLGEKEIYLPWKDYNNNKSKKYYIHPFAYAYVDVIHPNKKLKSSVRKLHARNMQIILGRNLDVKTNFVVCYTKDGVEHGRDYSYDTGGTGSAIALASIEKIPVYNLKNEGRYESVIELIKNG